MKQVSRGNGEGKGELARLDGVKTGAQKRSKDCRHYCCCARSHRACQTPTWWCVEYCQPRQGYDPGQGQQGRRVKGVYRVANRLVAVTIVN